MDHTCPEQVELCASVSLAFDQLQASDLSLDLAAAPGQQQGCAHGLLVLTQAGGEATQLAQSPHRPKNGQVGERNVDDGWRL